jgi:hypothetical protein
MSMSAPPSSTKILTKSGRPTAAYVSGVKQVLAPLVDTGKLSVNPLSKAKRF